MKCINCGQRVSLAEQVFYNVEAYGGPVVGVSSCCGAPYRVSRRILFDVEPSYTKETQDDWGEKIKTHHSKEKKDEK
jgi:hypothetical protein